MFCSNCGSKVAEGAKFCAECGTPVAKADDAATSDVTAEAVDTPAEEVAAASTADAPKAGEVEAPTEVVPVVPDTPAADEPAVEPTPDPTPEPAVTPEPTPATTSGAMPAATAGTPAPAPAAASSTPHPEKGVLDDFLAAVMPLVRTPIVVVSTLAAAVATVVSFAFGAIIAFLFVDLLSEDFEFLGGYGHQIDDGAFGVFANIDMMLHQVPLSSGDITTSISPLLFLALPFIAVLIGLEVAARVQKASFRGSVHTRAAALAVAYGVLTFIVSFFGPESGGDRTVGAHFHALLFGAAIAAAATYLHASLRWTTKHVDAAHDATHGPRTRGTVGGIFARATRALLGGIAASTVLALIALLVQIIVDVDEKGRAVLASVVYMLDFGVVAFTQGLFVQTNPDGDGDLIWDSPLGLAFGGEDWNIGAQILVIIAAFVPVLLAGIYSGFTIARDHPASKRNDRLAFAAGTGVVWAIVLTLLVWVAQYRFIDDGDVAADLSGVGTFFLALLFGAILGILGGILATTSRPAAVDLPGTSSGTATPTPAPAAPAAPATTTPAATEPTTPPPAPPTA